MVTDLDIYRAVNLIVDRYGGDALTEAARRVEQMLADGDSEGQIVWRRIKRAIEALQAAPTGPFH